MSHSADPTHTVSSFVRTMTEMVDYAAARLIPPKELNTTGAMETVAPLRSPSVVSVADHMQRMYQQRLRFVSAATNQPPPIPPFTPPPPVPALPTTNVAADIYQSSLLASIRSDSGSEGEATPPLTPALHEPPPVAKKISPILCPYCSVEVKKLKPMEISFHLRESHTQEDFYKITQWLSWHQIDICKKCKMPWCLTNTGLQRHQDKCDGVRETDRSRTLRRWHEKYGAGRGPNKNPRRSYVRRSKTDNPRPSSATLCPIDGCSAQPISEMISHHIRMLHKDVEFEEYQDLFKDIGLVVCNACFAPFNTDLGLHRHIAHSHHPYPSSPKPQPATARQVMTATAVKKEKPEKTRKRSRGWAWVDEDANEIDDDDDDNVSNATPGSQHIVDAARRIYSLCAEGAITGDEMAKMLAALPKK